MAERGGSRVHERWARLRFSIIGALLAAPPAKGALRPALQQLAAREWRHPSTGAPVRFGVSTLERWFYRALRHCATIRCGSARRLEVQPLTSQQLRQQ